MSLIMIFIALVVLVVAGYFVKESGLPTPLSWIAFAIIFGLAILLFLKITGIN